MGARTCGCGCGQAIPADSHPNQKYVDDRHRKRMEARRYRRRKRDQSRQVRSDAKPVADQSVQIVGRDESEDGRASARRGEGYWWLRRERPPVWLDYLGGRVTRTELLEALTSVYPDHLPALSGANLSRWRAAWMEDESRNIDDWEIDRADLAALDGGYRSFVERFYADDPEKTVRWFDEEWEREIDSVVGTGESLLLLAAQRHGKTQFLSIYCQRRITQDPDIRILWVSRTQDQAAESVGYIRQMLENPEYAEAVLGPGETFKPRRTGHSWTDTEFTVATRTKTLRAPTMRAIGIGQTISGRDADLIIIDDPQEREDIDGGTITGIKQKRWFFTTFMSRKMPHTGIAYITSRKHVQDIPAEIIDNHREDWRVITYNGHRDDCLIPEDDYEAHTDCVLWPEKRPFEHLMRLKRADPLWFECNVQNNPTTEKLTLVTKEQIAAAFDIRVRAGHFPPGWGLIAGFDPANGKENAATLWAYSVADSRAQIVTAKKFRSGPVGLAEAMEEWFTRFHCVSWVTETNWAGGFLGDPRVTAVKDKYGIRITPHTTRMNKVDFGGGVTSMIQMIHHEDLPIRFPTLGGDEDSEGIRQLIAELLAYDPDAAKRKHFGDDLVMSMWFPWWQKLQDVVKDRRNQPQAIVEYDSIANPLGGF